MQGSREAFPRRRVRGIEKDPELVKIAKSKGLDVVCGDGLAVSWKGLDVILNPPYKDAETWVRKGIEEAESCAVLLRLGFLASRKRRPLWEKHPPSRLVVLSKRPAFINGRTDACDYAWFIWERKSPVYTGVRISWIG